MNNMVNIAVAQNQPDIEYIVDQIAEAYLMVLEALETDHYSQAEFWMRELEVMVSYLRQWHDKGHL